MRIGMMLDLSKTMIDIELGSFKQYATTLEKSLAREQKEFNTHVEEVKAKWPGENPDDFYAAYEDDYWQLLEVFPNLLRLSFFAACYSFFEYELINICKYFQREKKYNVGLNDLKGGGIFRAQIYLKKVAEVDFPDTSALWNDIVQFNHMRNFIVHNGGKLDDSKEVNSLKRFIKNKNWVKLGNHDQIQFSKNFSEKIISTYKGFFDKFFRPFIANNGRLKGSTN